MSGTDTSHTSQILRSQLVGHLYAQHVIHSPAVANAFLAIPREAFVSMFYREKQAFTPRSNGSGWMHVDHTHQAYLQQIYEDAPLVTHLDSSGIPDSASSMPKVMALMLEALQVQKDHTVLEIGTGTGYNAALLTQLSRSVTTIDIEEEYVQLAQQRFAALHLNSVEVIHTHGIAGYPPAAPYDRIIVTASVPTVPMAWLHQLQLQGILICDIAGSLEHAFLAIEKDATGQIHGHILPDILSFMPMYGQNIPDLLRPRISPLPARRAIDPSCTLNVLVDALQHNRSFRWFLQTSMPGIAIQQIPSQRRIRLLASDHQSYINLKQEGGTWQGSLHADSDATSESLLWENIFQAFQQWQAIQPPAEQYTFHVEGDRAVFRIGDFIFPLLSLPEMA